MPIITYAAYTSSMNWRTLVWKDLLHSTGTPMLEKMKIERTAETFVEVIPSPLLPMVLPGAMSRILRSKTDFVELQPGLYSQDPDNPGNQTVQLDFLYSHLPITDTRGNELVYETCSLQGMEYYYFCKQEQEEYPKIGNEYVYQMISIPTEKPLVDNGGCFGNGAGMPSKHQPIFTSVGPFINFYQCNIWSRPRVTLTRK